MVQPFTGKAQTGANILGFKIGMLGQDLFSSQVGGEQIQYVRDANSHSSNTGASPHCLGFTVMRSTKIAIAVLPLICLKCLNVG